MPESGLFALYHLHQVDEVIQAMRSQAAALDTGAAELAEAKSLEEAGGGPMEAFHKLKAEQNRLETEQGTLASKAEKLDAALLDGSVHSERDRAAVAAELEAVKQRISRADDRLLELLEELPRVEEEAKSELDRIASLKAAAAAKMREAKSAHADIKAKFDGLLQRRAELAAKVPEKLLRAYEPVRAKKGTGMGMVTDDHRCSMCGSSVPEKVRDAVRRDEVQTCENCGRVLFRLEQHA